jgi:alkylation response protein AidB-like acyl-CoA dehydrogenase
MKIPPDNPSERECDFLERVRSFGRAEVAPNAAEWDRSEQLPREIFRKCAELGLIGTMVHEEDGGLGLSCTIFARAIRVLARHCAALALDVAAINSLCLGHVMAVGSEKQKKKAGRIIAGEWMGAWALTEPGAGSDTNSMTTVAKERADGLWELNGRKLFITQGGFADLLVVMATTGTRDDGRKEISAFLVEGSQTTRVRKIPTYGVRASETSELLFDDARAELLGLRGRGQADALRALERGRIGVAAVACGIADAAIHEATRFARSREAFGRTVADFQMVQADFADCATELDAAWLLALRAAAMQDEGRPTGKESAMAKLFASEAGVRICNRCMNILGGRGYSRDFSVERYLRDAKVCEIGEGTSNVQRMVIFRKLIAESAF